MSRNKPLLLWLLCLCLMTGNAFAQSPNLISEEKISSEAVRYSKTAVAETGVYERSYSASASEFYPYTYTVAPEVNNGSFAEYHVARRQPVKAGDLLVTLTLDVDERALAAVELSLARITEAYETGLLERQEEIAGLIKAQKQISDPAEREMMLLQIRRAQVLLEQYCYQQDTQIADLQRQLAEMQEENSQTQLFAPCDGVITDLTYKRVGERVYAGDVLVTLYREDGMLLRIDNSNLHFRYGMDVTVTSGNKQTATTYHGVVVAADNQLPSSRRLGHAFIRLDPFEGEQPRLTHLSVSAPSQYLENVMLIPHRAAKLEGGKHYVECLVDGNVQKRFINFGLSNMSQAWILQGLEPGDTVIID